jgi:tetratricopeptide (TPR) repeat protein
MTNLTVKRVFIPAVLACLFFWACASTNKELLKQASAESRQSLAAGDYQKALDIFKEAHKRNPRGKMLEASYVRTVEEIKRAAERALSHQDYVMAGNICRVLSNNFGDFGVFAAKLTFNKNSLEATLKRCRIGALDAQARQDLKSGNFAKALETYQSGLKEFPTDAGLAADYLRAAQEVKAAGDKALAEKDFTQSGRVNTLLLRSYPSFEGLQPAVAFARTDLVEAIAACRESLTRTGLAEYRKGNLAKAIAVWEDLLSFDPDNAEIQKAVATAKTQLNELIKKK